MTDTYRVRYSAAAASELEAIFDYIRQDSPQNAAVFISRMLDAIEGLAVLPHRYPLLNRAGLQEIRVMPVRPYLIRYYIDEDNMAVMIVSVRHGARRPEP